MTTSEESPTTTDNEPTEPTFDVDAMKSAIKAAPPVPFQNITHVRALPASPAYFSRDPQFNETFVQLAIYLKKFERIPTASSESLGKQSWNRVKDYNMKTGQTVKALPYSRALDIVKRLNRIEPRLMPVGVKKAIADFKRNIDTTSDTTTTVHIDRFGRALGVGRRKTSTARAWVVEGTGEVLINGKPLNDAFGRVHDRESAIWALRSTQRTDKYNVWALVDGGGTTGQAEALTLAIAKGLMAHEPALKPALRQAGCVTRDPRTVERKKHGRVKARKAPAWVKR